MSNSISENPPAAPADLAHARRVRRPAAQRIDRLPPYSPEAEQGVLGCILMDPKQGLSALLSRYSQPEGFFYDARHQIIYAMMLEMYEANDAIDIITLQQRLRDKGLLDGIGGLIYLNSLVEATPSSANLMYYAEIVWEKCLLRRLLNVCNETVESVYEREGAVVDLIDEAERAILAVRKSHASFEMLSITELVDASIADMEAMLKRKGSVRGLNTGFPDLDKLTDGLKPTEMTVIAGYPTSGKTSFAMNLVESVVLDQRQPVGVFSLEMTATSLVTRMLCSRARVNLRNIRGGYMADRDFPKITNVAGKLAASKLFVHDISDLTIFQTRAIARRMKQQHDCKFFVVDYLQLLSAVGGSRKVESRQQEVADISRGLKGMAMELEVPVVALSQLNDDGKLRESRAIGQDADNIFYLEPKDSPEGADSRMVDLRITKQRNGPPGIVNLVFLPAYTRFESAAKVCDEDVPDAPRLPFRG